MKQRLTKLRYMALIGGAVLLLRWRSYRAKRNEDDKPSRCRQMLARLWAGWLYIWTAAQVQPTILTALFVAGLTFVTTSGFFVFTSVAVAVNNGLISAIFSFFFLEILLAFPLTGSLFFLIALPSMRLRKWTFYDGGIREEWIHPGVMYAAHPSEIRKMGRERVLIATAWGGPMPSVRKHLMVSGVEVTEAMDTRQLQSDASDPQNRSFMAEHFNQVMATVVIGISLFIMLAIYSDGQAQKLAGV